MDQDDGFIELAPVGKGFTAKPSPVILAAYLLRGGPRLSVNIDDATYIAMGSPTRVSLAYNPSTYQLRLRSDNEQGKFEFGASPGNRKGKEARHIVRIEIPKGLSVGTKEPGPYTLNGTTLLITMPPPMREPVPQPSRAAIIAAAIPAPNFGTTKR